MSNTARYYGCQRCQYEIEFWQVEAMGRIDGAVFLLHHTCACQPGHVFERRMTVDQDALQRLLGSYRPVLPYRAAPGEAFPLHPDQERVLAIFRWECEQLESVDEFLLFAKRPLS